MRPYQLILTIVMIVAGVGVAWSEKSAAATPPQTLFYNSLPISVQLPDTVPPGATLSVSPDTNCTLNLQDNTVEFKATGLCLIEAVSGADKFQYSLVASPRFQKSASITFETRSPNAQQLTTSARLINQHQHTASPPPFDRSSETVVTGDSMPIRVTGTNEYIAVHQTDTTVCEADDQTIEFINPGRCELFFVRLPIIAAETDIVSQMYEVNRPTKQQQSIRSQLPTVFIVDADYDGSELLRVGENLITPIASASSGGALLYTSLTPSVCILSDQDELKIQTVDEGLCQVRATQPGDDAFEAVETTLEMTVYNPCGKNPSVCQNGGLCSNWIEGQTWQCDCPRQYNGDRCQYIDACLIYQDLGYGNPCLENSVCRSDAGGVRCDAPEGIEPYLPGCACRGGFDFPQYGFSCDAQGLDPTEAYCRDPDQIQKWFESLEN